MHNSVSNGYRKLVVNKLCHIILLPDVCLHVEMGGKVVNVNW